MIVVFTHQSRPGLFSARAEFQPDDHRSNFPPIKLGVSARATSEEKVALRCGRKAVAVLTPYMVKATAVRTIGAGCWIVEFKRGNQ
jgi:hypothetical protein